MITALKEGLPRRPSKDSMLLRQGAQVQSLAREPGSHTLRGADKK